MGEIETQFSPELNAYVVTMPASITLEALQHWGELFISKLKARSGKVGLLLDTGQHEFESVSCLQWLKVFLTQNPVVVDAIGKVAFVQPEEYRQSQIVSPAEAYFSSVDQAQEWLQRKPYLENRINELDKPTDVNTELKYGLYFVSPYILFVIFCVADVYLHMSGIGESNLGTWLLIFSALPTAFLLDSFNIVLGLSLSPSFFGIWLADTMAVTIIQSTAIFMTGYMVGKLRRVWLNK